MTSPSLPPNVHVSHHPCLRAKLSQLRSQHANARETKALIYEIALIVGCQALERGLDSISRCTDKSRLGYDYNVQTISPSRIALVPILRSGLGMLEDTKALQTLLPSPVPVHHLGLYREPTTLQPVEYYNKLPYHSAPSSTHPSTNVPSHSHPSSSSTSNSAAPRLAILDPIIATGGTSVAAIQTLKEWGVERVILISVLGSEAGVRRAAEEWREEIKVWVEGVIAEVDGPGMIVPGLGDVGDRLFLTRGK